MTLATGRSALPPLNEVQREAVSYNGGPRLIFAGAGTGKTRVLTVTIARLIQELNVPTNAIFAATFTNKAAREMRSRVELYTGLSCQGLWIGTFHSLCARILRREAQRLGYESAFAIYDEDDQEAVLRSVLKKLGIDERAMTVGTARSLISRWKNHGVWPDEALAQDSGFEITLAAKVYKEYEESLKQLQAMDFDDLLLNTVRLLKQYNDVRERYSTTFRYVLVDEFQDTNWAQFQLVKLLAEKHRNVFVVGDDDQSIYGWRGALVENILSFEHAFPGTRIFRLEQNYRSPKAVLDFANAVIAANRQRAPKALWTSSNREAEVTVTCYKDDRHEAEGVCERVARAISSGVRPCDIMILYRTNAQSRPFEEALRRARISYSLIGGISFYQRREVKDCLAYLRLLANPADNISFERIMNVPPRGLGPKAREELMEAATGLPLLPTILREPCGDSPPIFRHRGIAELRSLFGELGKLRDNGARPDKLLGAILTLSGYGAMLKSENSEDSRARLENIGELLNAVAAWCIENPTKGLMEFLEEAALATDVDTSIPDQLRVTCMTLHSAKGLEAPVVFITGLEEGLLPSRQNMEEPEKIEEERRLFYVGATRAQNSLHCSYVRQRWRFGTIQPMSRSRFLGDIPQSLYRFEDLTRASPCLSSVTSLRSKPQRSPSDNDFYSQEEVRLRMGQRVRHKAFGIGTVLSISGNNDDMRVTVLFRDFGRKRMLARIAGLEPL